MKVVLLDGNRIKNAQDMHAAYAEALELPEYYGANLDALFDVLTETTEEIGVILVNNEKLAEALGHRWTALLRLLVDVKRLRRGFKVSLDPFNEEELD